MPINKKLLFSCIALSLLLCLGQIMGSGMLILLCLSLYLILLGWGCIQQYTLPILLFFMPWSPILRMNPSSFSFYTFGLVMICCISIVKKRFSLKQYPLVAGILLAFLTLMSKLLDGSSLSFDYIAFLMMIVLFPTVKEEYRIGKYDFFHALAFLSLGIIIAALCALQYAAFPNIAQYIRVDSYQTIIRRSGFYGDANFYSAQITAALGGCLVLLLQEKKRQRILLVIVLLAVLTYCGFLSASKSFVLVGLVMLCLWLLRLAQMKNRLMLKLLLFLCIIILGFYIANSSVFGDLLEVIDTRFSSASDMDSLTTGRTVLWQSYLSEQIGNIKVFFLGKGFTNVKINERSSHNTILQMFYQLGLFGVPVLLYWMYGFLSDGIQNRDRKADMEKYMSILLIGVFLPWMAIDELFFDDFFMMQWYVFTAYRTNVKKENGCTVSYRRR